MKKILLTIALSILIICNCNIVLAATTLQLTSLPPNATLSDGSKVACGEAGAAASTGDDPSSIESPEVHSSCGKGGGEAPQKTGSSYSLLREDTASAMEAYLAEHAGSDEIYQAAVWAANGGFPSEGREWATSDVVSSAMNLVSAASTAGDFASAVTGTAGFSIDDNTVYDDMTTIKNEDGTITVGPYNISFNEGSANIHFNAGPEGEAVDGCVQKSGICIVYKINGEQKTKGVQIEGAIRSGKDFYITYNPYDNEKEKKDYIPYAQLKIKFSYFTGYSGATKNTYQGSRKVRTGAEDISHPYGEDDEYWCNATRYHYTEQKTQNMVQIVKGSPTWGTAEFESEIKKTEEFDLSLKKFISAVEIEGESIDLNRVTVKDTGRLYSKIDQNAVYNKIYDVYNITHVDNFTFTIRIYNEGDIAGKATIVQDHLPEGLNYEVIESSGYVVEPFDEKNRIITFKDEGGVRDLNPFTGGDLDYIDIKIKCTLDPSVYEDKEEEQKVYDLGIEQYIEEIKREGNVVDIDETTETNKNRNVKIGDEITYTIKVKNNKAETVHLKEIKQSLPKGIEFIYPEDMSQDENGIYIDENNYWREITNSDGTSEISRIVSADILGNSEITYNIRCKVTEESGILKTVSSIVSTAEQEINQSDWKDYAKITVIDDEQTNDYDLELSQEIVKINTRSVSGKEQYGLSIGDIVTYKITVKNTGIKEVKNVSIANYIPDGMRFIPPKTGDYIKEHEDIEAIVDKDIDDTVNEDWSINTNGNLSWTKINGIPSGTPETPGQETIELICVVEKEGTFKNIADIISFKDENGNNVTDIDSAPNNVKYNEYLYEKQEDDDDYSIVSTDSSDTQADLKIETSNLKVNGNEVRENTIINTGDEVTYEIKITNQGSIDAKKVEIKDVLQGLECTEIVGYNIDKVYDKSNKTISIEETIDKGQSKTISITGIVTEAPTTIELVNTYDMVDEDEVEQGKKEIKHTAYIKTSDIYDKTKLDWKAEQIVGILKAEIKDFEILEDNELDVYIKYLTNTAMIIAASETDRDTSDWKDTETVVIEEGTDPTTIIVKKVWKDEGDKYKKRPSSITVNLKANGEIVDSILLDINNNWQHTFTDLNKDVTYEVEEVSVSGYETEIRKNNNTYTITNVYEPPPTSTPTPGTDKDPTPTPTGGGSPKYKKITVTKSWEDNENAAGIRPDKVTVKLIGSDGSTRTVELNESKNWKHTFTGLKKRVTYTVQEVEVEGYTTQITGSETEGYNITNTKGGTPPPTSTTTPTPPPTTSTPTSTTTPIPPPGKITTMEIAGNVFEDLPSTKSGETDNRKGVEDIGFGGIKVTLYECDEQGKLTNIATLIEQYEENPNISKENAEIRTNPTITDEYGNYSFKGLETTKKYKVEFTYNGLVYESVEANDTIEYNSEEWSKTSKAVDNEEERNALNNKFSNIGSHPNNYEGNKKVYLQDDLENEKIYDGQNIYELIANKTRDFINNNRRYPSDEEINEEIAKAYIGVDSGISDKLQFIEDCKISAMTTKTYPIYNEFVVDDSTGSIVTDESSLYKINYKPYSEDDVPDFTDEYKSINEELQEMADFINKTIFDGTTYNVDDYFFISDAEGEGTLTGYTASVYTTDIKPNKSGEPKLKVSSDYVVLKNHLAWSINTHYGIPYSTDPESKYMINCNNIFEVFENNYSEIKNIVESIVKEAQAFYDNVANVIVSNTTDEIKIEGIPNIYPGQKQIHFGLKKREEFDLTIAKDVYKVKLKINNTEMEYYYNDVDIDSYTGDWVAEVRAADTLYERNIYASDYKYYENLEKESEGKTAEEKESIMEDKLNIEVTYRIALRNQEKGIIGGVTEIVDYFDSEYEYVSGSTFLGDGKGNNLTELRCEGGAEYAGLKTGYIKTLDGSDIIVRNGEDKFIYITFKVSDEEAGGIISDGQINKDGLKELLTNSSKQNIVEINGYKTYYDGTTTAYNGVDKSENVPAGILDKDSIPGNYEPDKNFDGTKYIADEDDVGVASGIYFLIDYYNQRIIKGTVWEDTAVEELLSQNIRQGNGVYEEGEKLVQNVRATLMKAVGADVYNDANVGKYYDKEKEEWLDAKIYTDENGEYSLTGFVPGDYEVWFTYDNNSINAKTTDSTYLETRYNGQDYKSTIYNEDLYVDRNDDGTLKTDENGNKVINNKWYSEEENRVSDAKDIWGDETNPDTKPGTRQYVNNYSETLTNDVAESLVPSNLAKYNTEATTMNAKTNVIKMDVEYLKTTSQSISNITNNEVKNDYSKYVIENIDFGLVERPRAQLSIQKNVANVKVVLADGTLLFDAVPAEDNPETSENEEGKFIATNLASIPRELAIACIENKEVTEGTETIMKLKNSTHVSREQGRITMNIDEELMQGAELRVTYEIAVENVGEIDYKAEDFYNKGVVLYNDDGTAKFEIVYNADGTINEDETKEKMNEFIEEFKTSNQDSLVTTKVEQIIDYVENNMRFNNTLDSVEINKNWEAENIEKIVAFDEAKGMYVNYKGDEFERSQVEIKDKTATDYNTYTIVRKDVLDSLFNKNALDEDNAYNTIAILNSSTGDTYNEEGDYTGNTATIPITPGNTAKSDFILTQLISSENENDDLTYKNVLEIVKSSNSVGRRMYFSIAGNHVPVERNEDGEILETSSRPTGVEIDTDDGELITLIPPFGANMQQNSQFAILAISLAAIFGIGVYLIKKKVLK